MVSSLNKSVYYIKVVFSPLYYIAFNYGFIIKYCSYILSRNLTKYNKELPYES